MSTPELELMQTHEVAQLGEFLQSVNARIARLAIALRVPLDTDADIQEAIKAFVEAPLPYGERRSGTDRRAASRTSSSPERRANMQRSELRGLLVMRYETEVKLAELVGATMSRQLIHAVAHNLERQGFEAGAGGALVNRPS